MALYNFKDNKSRKQINHAIVRRNDTKQLNADNLLRYVYKKSLLVGSRDEWEITQFGEPSEALNI